MVRDPVAQLGGQAAGGGAQAPRRAAGGRAPEAGGRGSRAQGLLSDAKDERERAANAAKHYNALRGRQESVAATTRERYNILEPRDGVRTERGIDAVPMPFGLDKE